MALSNEVKNQLQPSDFQACQSQSSAGCATAKSSRVTSPACPFWRTALFSFWLPCRRWTTASTPALLSTRQGRLRRSTNSKSTVSDLVIWVLLLPLEKLFPPHALWFFAYRIHDNGCAWCAYIVPPDFRDGDSPGNTSLVLSQSTSFLCDVTGSPTPVITWFKDGTPVSSAVGITP